MGEAAFELGEAGAEVADFLVAFAVEGVALFGPLGKTGYSFGAAGEHLGVAGGQGFHTVKAGAHLALQAGAVVFDEFGEAGEAAVDCAGGFGGVVFEACFGGGDGGGDDLANLPLIFFVHGVSVLFAGAGSVAGSLVSSVIQCPTRR